MFSNSTKYAIKAVLYLAIHSSETKRIMVKDISKPINVPQAYIAKLLQELSKQNIISSARGRQGGFYLSHANRKQSIMSIIDVIDGENKFNSCMLSLKECDKDKPCPLHNVVFSSKSNLIKSLESKSVHELSQDVKSGNSFLPL